MEHTFKHGYLALLLASLLISKASFAEETSPEPTLSPTSTETTQQSEPVEAQKQAESQESVSSPEANQAPEENTSISAVVPAEGSTLSEKKDTSASEESPTDKKIESEAIVDQSSVIHKELTDPKALDQTTVNPPIKPEQKKPDALATKKQSSPTTSTLIDVLELEDHASNKNYQKGYELAKKILSHWEGDSTFDFLYGVHAIETGHYDEATFAFERLTLLNPKTLRYRLELARALYFNNNLDTAKTEFEIALASNPPENVQTNIKGFLNKIKKSKEKATHNWAAGIGFDIGYDSNINSGTEEDGVDIPNIGFVSLQEEAQSLGSSFKQFNTQGIYSYSHKKHHSLDVSFNTTHKRNDEVTTYDLDVINLSGGYSWQPTRSIRIQGGLTSTNVKLDGEAYQKQNTINAMGLYTRKNGFTFSANINTGSRSAESETAPDADISLYALSVIWPSSNTKSTNLSLYSSNDDVSNPTLSHFGKDSTGIYFGTKLLITQSIVRSMLISISSTEYQSIDPNFQEVRKDTSIMGSWGYTWNASKYISVNTNFLISHNASNLDLFTSYRAIFNTGLKVNF